MQDKSGLRPCYCGRLCMYLHAHEVSLAGQCWTMALPCEGIPAHKAPGIFVSLGPSFGLSSHIAFPFFSYLHSSRVSVLNLTTWAVVVHAVPLPVQCVESSR